MSRPFVARAAFREQRVFCRARVCRRKLFKWRPEADAATPELSRRLFKQRLEMR